MSIELQTYLYTHNPKLFESQREMFLWIWEHRPHLSEVTGKPLGNEPRAYHFAHVLGKGAYSCYKLFTKNIVLMTFDEHQLYDHRTDLAKKDPKFGWVFELAQTLRMTYYKLS